MTPQKIFRVSHPADPVPPIPLFPFWRLAFGKDGTTIAKTSNALVSIDAHSMRNSYGKGMAKYSWSTLGHGGGALKRLIAQPGKLLPVWLGR